MFIRKLAGRRSLPEQLLFVRYCTLLFSPKNTLPAQCLRSRLLMNGQAQGAPVRGAVAFVRARYDEFGRLKKKFRGGGEADRKAREAAALARLRGDPPPSAAVRTRAYDLRRTVSSAPQAGATQERPAARSRSRSPPPAGGRGGARPEPAERDNLAERDRERAREKASERGRASDRGRRPSERGGRDAEWDRGGGRDADRTRDRDADRSRDRDADRDRGRGRDSDRGRDRDRR